MARVRFLSVGQCGFDHGQISRRIGRHFDAEVVPASTHEQALAALRSSRFDLVLVNRVGDEDGALGLDLVRVLKSDEATSSVPLMLVSNYESAQNEAIRIGAVHGFGKADLGTGKELAAIESIFQQTR